MRVAIQIVPSTTRIIIRKKEREVGSRLKINELPPLMRILAAIRMIEQIKAPAQKPRGMSLVRLITNTRCSPFSKVMPGSCFLEFFAIIWSQLIGIYYSIFREFLQIFPKLTPQGVTLEGLEQRSR